MSLSSTVLESCNAVSRENRLPLPFASRMDAPGREEEYRIRRTIPPDPL